MGDTKLYRNVMQLGEGIELCFERTLVIPGLILLYSAIDVTSWLASEDPSAPVREYFTDWVQVYMLRRKPLGCNAIELYSARCGLVHTLTPDSRLVEQGRVRRIAYAWGTAQANDLQRLIDRNGWSDRLVSVHVGEVYEAWKLGFLDFTDELQDKPQKAASVYDRANKFFADLSAESVDEILGKDDPQTEKV